MTKKISLLLATVLFLASCSNRIELVKRKYNKGYYVSVIKKNKDLKQRTNSENRAEAVAKTPKKSKPLRQATESPEQAMTSIAKPQNNDLQKEEALSKPVNRPVTNTNVSSSKPGSSAVASSINQTTNKEQHIKSLPSLRERKNILRGLSGKGGDDTNTILLVILCLFWWLNLVAIYLHDGKKITKNFWITLVLNLTIIGGIIFAILVVLDVIDFA